MRIVNIILTSVNGGAEQVFIDYLRVLKNNLGHEVFAITKHDAPYANKVEDLQIPIKKIKNNFGYYDFFAVNEIKKVLQEFNADAVVAHAGRSMVLARKAIKKIKNKKIFEVDVNHSMNVKRSIGADIVISVNKDAFFNTVDQGQNYEKSFVIHNAIDLQDAEFKKPQIDWKQKQTITIGCIGRLDKAKGFRFAIKAIKLLENYPNKKFILKIAGLGPRKAYLENLIKELKVEDKVEFVGWVTDKKKFFDAIDIFMLTSQRETFGLVILEAMKFGKPVIACDADGPKEIMQNKVNGLLISLEPLHNTEERFAEALKQMVENSELTNLMIEGGYKTLKEKFSYECLAEKLKDIFG